MKKKFFFISYYSFILLLFHSVSNFIGKLYKWHWYGIFRTEGCITKRKRKWKIKKIVRLYFFRGKTCLVSLRSQSGHFIHKRIKKNKRIYGRDGSCVVLVVVVVVVCIVAIKSRWEATPATNNRVSAKRKVTASRSGEGTTSSDDSAESRNLETLLSTLLARAWLKTHSRLHRARNAHALGTFCRFSLLLSASLYTHLYTWSCTYILY